MFGYKDMCFCSYEECKKFNECFRALTTKIQKGAELAELPICQFAEKPECFIGDENEITN
jgi:hypothetical protein